MEPENALGSGKRPVVVIYDRPSVSLRSVGFCLLIRLCPEAQVRVELVAARVRRIQYEGIDFPFVEIVPMMALEEKQTLLLPFLAFLAMEFLPFFKACFILVVRTIILLIAADVGHVPVRLGRTSSAVMG